MSWFKEYHQRKTKLSLKSNNRNHEFRVQIWLATKLGPNIVCLQLSILKTPTRSAKNLTSQVIIRALFLVTSAYMSFTLKIWATICNQCFGGRWLPILVSDHATLLMIKLIGNRIYLQWMKRWVRIIWAVQLESGFKVILAQKQWMKL